jgi:hypothetical protein
MSNITPGSKILPVAFSALLALSACGGGDSSSDSGPVAQDPPPPQPTSAPTPAPTSAPDPTPAPTPAPTSAPDEIALDTKLTGLIGATVNSQPPWPDGSGTGKSIDGIDCASSVMYHLHALVSLYKDGVRLGLPQEIGLRGCAYEMHTHDRTGIVHMEAPAAKPFRLGQFFSVWGKDLSQSSVAGLAGPVRYYLIANGKITPFAGDPKSIVFTRHLEVLIVVGKAPAMVPQYEWPAGL